MTYFSFWLNLICLILLYVKAANYLDVNLRFSLFTMCLMVATTFLGSSVQRTLLMGKREGR